MKFSFVLISFLLVTFLPGCNRTPDLTENEVYTILNEIIADDSLSIHIACWKFQDIPLKNDYQKEFTEHDIKFIRDQKNIFKSTTIKPNKLKWFHKRNKTFKNTAIDTVCNNGILYHISFPLISSDRRKVLIEFQEDCNCMLGGQGGKYLYIKQNGHWKKIKSFDRWIS